MKSNFLSLICLIGFSLITTLSMAQEDKSTRPSPPAEAKGMIKDAKITINYSSPSVKGRKIWGDLVPYDKVWRTGANEATIFETSTDLVLNNAKLPAGKYALFTIPGEAQWTFIFNSVWEQWGAFKYDESKDVLRVAARPKASSVFHEKMMFEVKENKIVLSWENVSVSLKGAE